MRHTAHDGSVKVPFETADKNRNLPENGLSVSVFSNFALAGRPMATLVANTSRVTVPPPDGFRGVFSAEAVGTLSLASMADTPFAFDCDFDNVSAALVWVDDHLVCQHGLFDWSGDARQWTDGSPANPLRRLPGGKADFVVRIRMWSAHTVVLGPLPDTGGAACAFGRAMARTFTGVVDHQWAEVTWPRGRKGAFTVVQRGTKGHFGAWVRDGVAQLEVRNDDGSWQPLVPPPPGAPGAQAREAPNSLAFVTLRDIYGVRLQTPTWNTVADGSIQVCLRAPDPGSLATVPMQTTVRWGRVHGNTPQLFAMVDPGLLRPQIPAAEAQRAAEAQEVAKGWALWSHASMMHLVLLPQGSRLAVELCRGGDAAGRMTCMTRALAPTTGTPTTPTTGRVRPSVHAADFSYIAFHVAWEGLNVSIAISGGTRRLLVRADLVACAPTDTHADCNAVTIRFTAGVAYAPVRLGSSVQVSATRLKLIAPGLHAVDVFVGPDNLRDVVRGPPAAEACLTLRLRRGAPVSVTSGKPMPSQEVADELQRLRQAELQRYEAYGSLADVKQAMQCVLMGNLIWTPAELGPIAPVSRGWSFQPRAVIPDLQYVLFNWDAFFASFMFSLDRRALAYSNFMQVRASRRDLAVRGRGGVRTRGFEDARV